jgi:hypothetical protein
MNIKKYTLTVDGKIPDHITDGGYFPKQNNNDSPQDFDLIGLSNIGNDDFSNKNDFEIYIKSFNNDSYEMNGDIYYLQDIIDYIWSKK